MKNKSPVPSYIDSDAELDELNPLIELFLEELKEEEEKNAQRKKDRENAEDVKTSKASNKH